MWLEHYFVPTICSAKAQPVRQRFQRMFCMPPGLMTGGIYFANMWSASEIKHMVQGGFRMDDDSNKHIFLERRHGLHRPFYLRSSVRLWLRWLTL